MNGHKVLHFREVLDSRSTNFFAILLFIELFFDETWFKHSILRDDKNGVEGYKESRQKLTVKLHNLYEVRGGANKS